MKERGEIGHNLDMFSYSMRETADKKAVYGPAGPFRFLCGFFAVLLAYALVTVIMEAGFDWTLIFPIAVILFLAFSAIYRDEWIFDNVRQEATNVFGVGPFAKKRVVAYDDIARLEVTHFLKGIPDGSEVATKASWRHPSMIVLSVVLDDEEETRMDIEITKEKSNGTKLAREASRLAAYTDLDLRMDRENYNTRKL